LKTSKTALGMGRLLRKDRGEHKAYDRIRSPSFPPFQNVPAYACEIPSVQALIGSTRTLRLASLRRGCSETKANPGGFGKTSWQRRDSPVVFRDITPRRLYDPTGSNSIYVAMIFLILLTALCRMRRERRHHPILRCCSQGSSVLDSRISHLEIYAWVHEKPKHGAYE
jgi:hypothetical protein